MRPWIVLLTGLVVLSFGHSNANAGQDQPPNRIVVAQSSDDLPRNIELKPEAAKTAEDAASPDKTRQIVTESKDTADDTESDAEAADPADTAADDDAADTADETAAPEKPAEPEKAEATEKPAEPEKAAEADAASEADEAPENLALAVQTELKRVGCYFSSLDGLWGRRSQQALAAFGHFAKADIGDLSPTAEVLAIIKEKDGAVCVAEIEEPGPAPAPPPRARRKGYGGYGRGGYGGY